MDHALTRLIVTRLLTALPTILAALALGVLRPRMTEVAGAVAGLLSAGLAATVYASHCTDDSPLFVATWYTLATAIVASVGALMGKRALRY